ncbi:hypothetical protein OAJ18_00830 [Pelagibacteraceae bacterium]|nr:hypothetical protein [Pelagibacteraceae bacterium]
MVKIITMTENLNFYKWFETIVKKLGYREISFRKIFKYLDSQPTPIIIVETGCLRAKDNFLDGQSTLLFDKYTLSRGEKSKVYTVDNDSKSTEVCKEVVSSNVEITTEDSVRYLNNLSNIFSKNKTKVSMFYLDSFDVDWRYPYPSAAHHLKELTSITRILNKDTLVVVDDAPANANITLVDDSSAQKLSSKLDYMEESGLNWKIIKSPSPPPTIGGKGFLVHEYASHVKAKLIFSHYQSAWKDFNKV